MFSHHLIWYFHSTKQALYSHATAELLHAYCPNVFVSLQHEQYYMEVKLT